MGYLFMLHVQGGFRSVPYHEYLNIPFKFRGRDKQGTDCLGLMWMYLRSRGYVIPDRDGLPMLHDNQEDFLERAIKGLQKIGEQVNVPQNDDIVLMNLPGGYTHIGVVVSNDQMLHVLKDRPSVVEPIRKYRRRIVAIFRPSPSRKRPGF
jgi:cell wall-associated NlpC family hydrolase